MHFRLALAVLTALVCITTSAIAEDRVTVKNGQIYKGNGPKIYRAIHQDGLCDPNLEEGAIIQAFIRVSYVGARNLAFTLDGFNEDGTEIDPAYVDAAVKIKDNGNYRWCNTICDVMGSLEDASPQVRLNAARTAGAAMKEHTSMLYVIRGEDSAALVEAFKEEGIKLGVAATHGSDIAVIDNVRDMLKLERGTPAILWGDIPEGLFTRLGSVLPDERASYDRYEARSAHPVESQTVPYDPEGLTPEEAADGFKMLFNGKNLDHWTITGRQDGFALEDGNIVWKRRGGHRVLSRKRYDNFVLRLEYKIHHPNGNSGIFIRAPRANRESSMGMEFQIMGDHGLEPHQNSTGAIYDQVAATSNPSRPEGEWNDLEIRLDKSHMKVTLNGVVVQDLNLYEYTHLRHRAARGFIALQDHNDPASFRNIRVREL